MNKGLNDLSFSINYSLSQELKKLKELKELKEKSAKLKSLEEKIVWINQRLANEKDPYLIPKLFEKKAIFEKEIEILEKEKNNLNSAITKIKYLTGSINDFTLFFIFIRRFYTLTVLKQNFENVNKRHSLKLVNKLKTEEENLYKEYVLGNCFSKVLLALDFERYQSYFKKFVKDFFENIHYTSDPYVNSLLRLKAVFFECTHFTKDDFNLTYLKFFLSKNIPLDVALPNSNYELVALRCFFFYELLMEFLALKPITTHFDDLKHAVILDLSIIDYKANIKDMLIFSLNNLKDALEKINNKHNIFLKRKAIVDKEADINHALTFYKVLEDEIKIINKKSKSLIDNKYFKLEKMQHLLAIIVDEANLPKFLETFNRTIGNDFPLNMIENPDIIVSNKEALSFLFNLLCRNKFYISINERVSSFIKEHGKIYSKVDVSILDSLKFEDLIEFSFYYLFTMLYLDFNISLSGFNTKLSYSELVTSNVFFNIKFQSLEILLKQRKKEIKKFLRKNFKNIDEYNIHRKKILEEIKLSLETIRDLNHSLSEMKSLQTSLIPIMNDSSVPMPEKNQLHDLLKTLEEKQNTCDAEYQEVEKHKFINKYKPENIEINEVKFKEGIEIENNKSIEALIETLSRLPENLTESLKHIKETSQDVNRFRQKISSSLGKLSSSMQKFLLNLSTLENAEEMQDLTGLSLAKLLETVEKLVNKKKLFGKDDFKKKLTELRDLLNSPDFSIDFIVNLVIDKYIQCNHEAKKILHELTTHTKNSQFFSKQVTKKIKNLIIKLSNEYVILKEQSSWLDKLFKLIKFEEDDRIIKLYAMRSEAELINKNIKEKIEAFEKLSNGVLTLAKQVPTEIKEILDDRDKVDKIVDLHYSLPLTNEIEDRFSKNLNNEEIIDTALATIENDQKRVLDNIYVNKALINQEQLDYQKKLKEKNTVCEISHETKFDNSIQSRKTILQDYEAWDLEFEKWKNEFNSKLYELFHIIEICSKEILNGSGKAFLNCLSLYHKKVSEKNDILKEKKNQITLYIKNSNQPLLMLNNLAQRQKWFDEIFQRIDLCKTLILQNEDEPMVQESSRLPSSSADNRAEFYNLLTFYVRATNKYNKLRDELIIEKAKLNDLNRSFIKLMLVPLDVEINEANGLSDFSKQLDRVNQLKLAIEKEFETKQKIKQKLSLLANPEIVYDYLNCIDPYDAESLKMENDLPSTQVIASASYHNTAAPPSSVCIAPSFYYLPPLPVVSSRGSSISNIYTM